MNVGPALYAAVAARAFVVNRLGEYNGGPSIHTRRPVPEGAEYPMVVISPDVTFRDEDGVDDDRPVITRDVAVYGEQPDAYRVVEEVGYELRSMFHRERNSLTVAGYNVIQITASGPVPAPTDDDRYVGRMVSLTIRLARN